MISTVVSSAKQCFHDAAFNVFPPNSSWNYLDCSRKEPLRSSMHSEYFECPTLYTIKPSDKIRKVCISKHDCVIMKTSDFKRKFIQDHTNCFIRLKFSCTKLPSGTSVNIQFCSLVRQSAILIWVILIFINPWKENE